MSTHDDAAGVGRRSVLRAAAVAGGLAWTAPLVQVVAAPAFAAGTPRPGSGLSYVAVLLKAAGTLYRVKFEAPWTKGEVGPSFATPVCGTFPSSGGTSATGSALKDIVLSSSGDGTTFQLRLSNGVKLVDWVAKQGTCCIAKGGAESQTSQAGTTGSGYAVAISPGAPGSTVYTWPPAPNAAPCSLLPTATATPTATRSTSATATATTSATSTATTGP